MKRPVGWMLKFALVAASLMMTTPVAAQVAAVPAVPGSADTTMLQSADAAIGQDAAAVAERLGLPPAEAARQLRLQQASIAATDEIAARHAGRLAGIAIEHVPAFRIVALLTDDDPVPGETLDLNGEQVEVAYVTGARAAHAELVQAISAYQATIRASLIGAPGLGIDQRTGELVAVVSARDVMREGAEQLRARLAALTHMPVRLRVVDGSALDLRGDGIAGGMRMMGGVPGDPRQYLCTAGFVVTDGIRTALATAAHCPDALRVRTAAGTDADLPFAGQWGWGYQDVQINLSAVALAPVFYADTAKTLARPVVRSASRAGTRAGDIVCHRGERTGYSCSVVELTDFAPAGDLCGGACLPTWTTVAGPVCKSGDSGAPVFLGTTAYGILKGGSYRADGSCAFYFYMSIDYLPPGWRILTTPDAEPVAPPTADPDSVDPVSAASSSTSR